MYSRFRKKKGTAGATYAAFTFLPCIVDAALAIDKSVTAHTYSNLIAAQMHSPKKWNDSIGSKELMSKMKAIHEEISKQNEGPASQEDAA